MLRTSQQDVETSYVTYKLTRPGQLRSQMSYSAVLPNKRMQYTVRYKCKHRDARQCGRQRASTEVTLTSAYERTETLAALMEL
jgi:hypothetical protein